MVQLDNDCFAFGGPMMAVEPALALLAGRVGPVTATETVPLTAALGRVLAADLVAPFNVPPHDNAAVDGYAVFFDDLAADTPTLLPVTARVAAGQWLGRPAVRGEVVRIFTGAPMPTGMDTVFMQEDCRSDGATVTLPAGIRRGVNRRLAGEDVREGSVVLAAGRRLRPEDIALAASLGHAVLEVRCRLRVAVFSTGDELRQPGQALEPGAVYDANRFALIALLTRLGCAVTDLGILPDRFETIRDALAEAAGSHDALITSGGMSTGEEDHVKPAVEANGRLDFWRLAIKPGRPVALGRVRDAVFIGLPGNPVAVVVTFLRIARPILLRLMGAAGETPRPIPVRAVFAHKKKPGRREFLRGSLTRGTDGALEATKYPRDGAGVLSSLVESEGLIELPEELARVEPGMTVDFLPFKEFL
ncbi:molybdopterin molybdotransferase [Azospirillum lipoferum]|uniref:Molybdopterin molybdenumtransferase n=1 Tax=Azospirillum lipoferum TaxID=193 RepID=A0A5A9GX01_AZOLI|nr:MULTISPECIES: gephyrin-like molybdotransferase Glp [Azospirillum]KAA0598773.1 molybdopterin molybdotransferase MoeA [Azospirillum lipoferum]MCP1609195.1 molybdopterin molybdotransferase [Azospirillum lipoferum]MDW5535495.1 molybdopterin molybdotransferase MoeA [Azospirillum sp. NL1]